MKAAVPVTGLLLLSACATARLHSEAELNGIGQACGLALGELVQDESQKKLLFLIRASPSPAERRCIARWARERHLHLVIIDGVEFSER